MAENRLIVDAEKCVGCGLCVKACPFGAMEMQSRLAVVKDNCTFCGACVPPCRPGALRLERAETKGTPDIGSYKGVWVFGEQIGGVIQPVVLELVGKGRELADARGVPLTVVVLEAEWTRRAAPFCDIRWTASFGWTIRLSPITRPNPTPPRSRRS